MHTLPNWNCAFDQYGYISQLGDAQKEPLPEVLSDEPDSSTPSVSAASSAAGVASSDAGTDSSSAAGTSASSSDAASSAYF